MRREERGWGDKREWGCRRNWVGEREEGREMRREKSEGRESGG